MTFRDILRDFQTRELSQAALSSKMHNIASEEASRIAHLRPHYIAPKIINDTLTEIDYRFAWLPEASQLGLDTLIANSPDVTGLYESSFFLVVDGIQHTANTNVYDIVDVTSETVEIGNLQPYNRRVDLQLIGSRPMKFSVPPGLYDAAAEAVNRQFGNVAQVVFKNPSYLRRIHARTLSSPQVLPTPSLVIVVNTQTE